MVAHDIWDVEARFKSDIFYCWIAQMARAFGSYPKGYQFNSDSSNMLGWSNGRTLHSQCNNIGFKSHTEYCDRGSSGKAADCGSAIIVGSNPIGHPYKDR